MMPNICYHKQLSKITLFSLLKQADPVFAWSRVLSLKSLARLHELMGVGYNLDWGFNILCSVIDRSCPKLGSCRIGRVSSGDHAFHPQ